MKSYQRPFCVTIVLAAFVLFFALTLSASAQPNVARNHAVLVSGWATFCPARGAHVPMRHGFTQAFSPGDVLLCGPHSRLWVRLDGSSFPVNNPDAGWQDWPIPAVFADTGPCLYLPTLGRARDSVQTEPNPVDPAAFLVRWNPRPNGGTVSLRLSSRGKTLWTQDRVDAGAGCLFSADARKALRRYQASGAGGPVLLESAQDGRFYPLVRFNLSVRRRI